MKNFTSVRYMRYIGPIWQQNDGKSNDGVRSQPCLERANAPKSKGWTAVAAANVVAEQPAVGGAGDQVPLTQWRVSWRESVSSVQRIAAVSPWRSTTVPVGVVKSAQPIAATTVYRQLKASLTATLAQIL